MMKTIICILLLGLPVINTDASAYKHLRFIMQDEEQPAKSDSTESREPVDNLYNEASGNVSHATVEKADRLLRQVRKYSLDDMNDEQADKVMAVYRAIADMYAANFRFKPAYLVYNEYIKLKDAYLLRKKNQRLEKIDFETRQMKNANSLSLSANEEKISNLKNENESLASAKTGVYSTIWILVVVVAFLSGTLIWYVNHKYSKASHQLNKNRKRMEDIYLLSSIGEFNLDANNANRYLTGLEELKHELSSVKNTNPKIYAMMNQLKQVIGKL